MVAPGLKRLGAVGALSWDFYGFLEFGSVESESSLHQKQRYSADVTNMNDLRVGMFPQVLKSE